MNYFLVKTNYKKENRLINHLKDNKTPHESFLNDKLPGYVMLKVDGGVSLGGNGTFVKRIPMTSLEVASFKEEKEVVKEYHVGENFNISDGAFAGMNGEIKEVRSNKLIVSVSIFGRQTPVEISLD
jgi:transcription antitermination factor NusG